VHCHGANDWFDILVTYRHYVIISLDYCSCWIYKW